MEQIIKIAGIAAIVQSNKNKHERLVYSRHMLVYLLIATVTR